MTNEKSNKLIDYLLEIEGNENEPYVNIPNSTHVMDHSKSLEIKINQQRRQKEKFNFFLNTFDFLNDSQIEGDYYEFGVHKARTFRMALSCAKFYNIQKISFHAFDSFEGLPDIGKKIIKQWTPNSLTTSIDTFKKLVSSHGLYKNNFYCYKGFYKNVLTSELSDNILKQHRKACLVNVDCDYYESAVSVFNFIEPFIQHGTVIYLDDVFSGFTENSNGGVYSAFQDFKRKSNFNYISHLNIGWWGKSFIASKK